MVHLISHTIKLQHSSLSTGLGKKNILPPLPRFTPRSNVYLDIIPTMVSGGYFLVNAHRIAASIFSLLISKAFKNAEASRKLNCSAHDNSVGGEGEIRLQNDSLISKLSG